MSRKTSAVIRIVTWSLLAVFLIGILTIGLKGGSFFNFHLPFTGFNGSFGYANSEEYTVGGGAVDMEGVQDIELNWNSGNVNITSYDGSQITFDETSQRSLEEDQRMRYLVKNGKLTIQFCAPYRNFGFWNANIPDKTLEMKVPKALAGSLKEFEVSGVSAVIHADGLSAKKLVVDNVSGSSVLTNIQADTLAMDTVSGEIEVSQAAVQSLDFSGVSGDIIFRGEAVRVDTDSVSGKTKIDSSVCPDKVSMSAVSGDLSLTIPDNKGFTAGYDSVSGDFTNDFPGTSKKGKSVYKDGGASFDFDTVSGDIEIKQSGSF